MNEDFSHVDFTLCASSECLGHTSAACLTILIILNCSMMMSNNYIQRFTLYVVFMGNRYVSFTLTRKYDFLQ